MTDATKVLTRSGHKSNIEGLNGNKLSTFQGGYVTTEVTLNSIKRCLRILPHNQLIRLAVDITTLSPQLPMHQSVNSVLRVGDML